MAIAFSLATAFALRAPFTNPTALPRTIALKPAFVFAIKKTFATIAPLTINGIAKPNGEAPPLLPLKLLVLCNRSLRHVLLPSFYLSSFIIFAIFNLLIVINILAISLESS